MVAAAVGVVGVVAAAVQEDMCLTMTFAEAAEVGSCLDDCCPADSEVDPARRRCSACHEDPLWRRRESMKE